MHRRPPERVVARAPRDPGTCAPRRRPRLTPTSGFRARSHRPPCVPSQARRSGGRQKCLFKTASAARPRQFKQVSSVETVPSLLPGPAPLPRLTPRGCHMLPSQGGLPGPRGRLALSVHPSPLPAAGAGLRHLPRFGAPFPSLSPLSRPQAAPSAGLLSTVHSLRGERDVQSLQEYPRHWAGAGHSQQGPLES